MSEINQESLNKAIDRAKWLEDHKAPNDWLIITNDELNILKKEIADLKQGVKDLCLRLYDKTNEDVNQAKKIDETWRSENKKIRFELNVTKNLLVRVRNSANGLPFEIYSDIQDFLNS